MSTAVDLDTQLRARLRAITERAAPPFAEEARGELVAGMWAGLGLEVHRDELGDLSAELPGGTGPRVMLVAHLDTVFPAATDVTLRELDDGRWAAPGVGDNSASLAVLTVMAEVLLADPGKSRPRITLAASVGEEGLGDIRGARRLAADHKDRIDLFVAIDGQLGSVVTEAVGSRRFEARYRAKGGHSWGDYPSPSAVHAVGDAIHALCHIDVPKSPRSSLNVGVVGGGTSVNAIAEEASLTLDLRSVDPATLAALSKEAETRMWAAAKRHQATLELRPVGDRPAGSSATPELVRAARTALAKQGIESRSEPSSTDANAAVALGIPAICFGVYRGGDAHRLSEWVDPTSLRAGLTALLDLAAELSALPSKPD